MSKVARVIIRNGSGKVIRRIQRALPAQHRDAQVKVAGDLRQQPAPQQLQPSLILLGYCLGSPAREWWTPLWHTTRLWSPRHPWVCGDLLGTGGPGAPPPLQGLPVLSANKAATELLAAHRHGFLLCDTQHPLLISNYVRDHADQFRVLFFEQPDSELPATLHGLSRRDWRRACQLAADYVLYSPGLEHTAVADAVEDLGYTLHS